MKAAHAGAAEEHVHEERLAAARWAVEAARQHVAESLLVTAGTFADNVADPGEPIRELQDRNREFPRLQWHRSFST